MSKNIQKLDRLLRVWIAAISVLTATDKVQASSLNLPELDRNPLLISFTKPNSPGRKPAKYVVNTSDLTWDDSADDTMLHGQDKDTAVAEARRDNKLEEWSFDEDDELVLNALSYYPNQPDASNVSGMAAVTDDEVNSLLKEKILESSFGGISDEELELSYRELEELREKEAVLPMTLSMQRNEQELESSISEMHDVPLNVTPMNEAPTAALSKADTNKEKLEEQDLTVMLNESDKKLTEKAEATEAAGETRTEQGSVIKNSRDVREVQNISTGKSEGIELASRSIGYNVSVLVSGIDKRFNVGSSMVAVAAGDEDVEATVLDDIASFYINPFIGDATQKATSKLSNYHSRSKGATVGYDACFNDSLQLGVSFTKAASKLSFINNKLGERSKVKSNFYSLYGLYMPSNQNIFISGIGIYGISDISSKARRYVGKIATSNHKAYSNIAQVMLGSNYNLLNSLKVKPMLGVKYSKIRDASYEEEGAKGYNLSVSRAKEKVVEAITGCKLSTTYAMNNSVSVTPEVHAFAHKNIQLKLPSINASLAEDGALLPPLAINRSKLSFSYGSGITVRNRVYELDINYNGNAANKYISHSGSMKLKINL